MGEVPSRGGVVLNGDVAKTFSWNVGRLRSVAFSPDGNRAAVGSDTHRVVVFDVDV